MKVVIVIPTYNERDNISDLLEKVFALDLEDLGVIVVDDNSPDDTARVVENLQSKHSKLKLLERAGKLGLGSAYIAGFKQALYSGADLIFQMDADGSHDPQDIPQLIAAIRNGAEVSLGSRRVKGGKIIGWAFHRHLASWGAMMASRLILGIKTKDPTTGFRCYRREVLEQLPLNGIKTNGYAFQEEMIWLCEKNAFKVKEIPITFRDRERGQSKLSWRDISEFFIIIIRLRLTKFKTKSEK